MTIGSVSLPEITHTLAELQAPPTQSTSPVSTIQQSQAFAATLSQAASALSADLSGGSSTSGSSGLGVSAGPGTSGAGLSTLASANAELNLISLLLSGQSGAATGVTSTPPVSGPIAPSSPQVPAVAGAQSPGSSAVSSVVNLATSLEGTPYVWGGTTPAGFDCSGLVQYVYGQSGINLPRTSQEQANAGTPVSSLAAAQPGDLLFFAGSDGTAASPGHVGIYVGNGQMIDAPYTGTVVQQQAVPSAGVVAIRRVLPNVVASNMVMGQVTVPAQYVSTIQSAAASNGIPASLLAALVSHESGFNPSAMSSAGAEGIAQFKPTTAAGMGVNPFDPTQAINGAAKLLGAYTSRFGSYAEALAAYNAGPTAVARYGGVPPYPETQAYVPAVLNLAGLSSSGQGSLA